MISHMATTYSSSGGQIGRTDGLPLVCVSPIKMQGNIDMNGNTITNNGSIIDFVNLTCETVTASEDVATPSLSKNGGTEITLNDNILPVTDATKNLGSALKRFNTIYASTVQADTGGTHTGDVANANDVETAALTAVSSAITMNSGIQPATNGTLSLGVTGKRFLEAYINTLYGDVTGNVSGTSGSTTGNALTATTLQTARNINGTSFNGSADITVTAAADTLTGNTLASGVTASSLTSTGLLSALAFYPGTVAVTDTGALSSGDVGKLFLVTPGSAITITPMAGSDGMVIRLKHTGTNGLIATLALATSYYLSSGDYVELRHNGTAWKVINERRQPATLRLMGDGVTNMPLTTGGTEYALTNYTTIIQEGYLTISGGTVSSGYEGYFQINAMANLVSSAGEYLNWAIRDNGGTLKYFSIVYNSSTLNTCTANFVHYFSGSNTDTLKFYLTSNASTKTVSTGSADSGARFHLSITRLGGPQF